MGRDEEEILEVRGWTTEPGESRTSSSGVGDILTVSLSYLVQYSQFIDAVRIKDGAMVALKKVVVAKFPEEIAISQYFTQEPLAAEKDNHCVPVIEVLNLPDGETALLVLPLLRAFDSPPFVTIGEVLDFCGQICEVLVLPLSEEFL